VRSAFAGAALAAAGIAAVLTFGASLDALIEEPARTGWNWTLRIDPEDDELDEIADAASVEDVGRATIAQVVVDGEDVLGNAMASVKGTPAFAMVSGRMPSTDEEVAVGPELADRTGLGIGDRVTVTAPDGEQATKVIVGEALFPTFDDDNTFNDGVALTPRALETFANSDGDETVVVTFADGISEDEAADRLAAIAPDAVSVYSYPSLPTDVANLEDVRPLPRALGVFLALLGLAAVGHALTTSVQRRRRELGTVRSFGFLSRDVRRAVAAQSTTLVLGGLIVGLPLGVVVGRTVWRVVAEGLGVDAVPTVPLGLLASVALTALLAGLAVAWYPGHRAGRGVALDALRSE
jgi:ABC-type lipoprotein release transport system permease subunit